MGSGRNTILIVFIGFVVVGLLVTFFVAKANTAQPVKTSKDSSFPVSLIPIWIAVFVPIIARKKQNNQEENKLNRQKWLLIIGVLLLLFALALTLFFIQSH